MARAVAAAPNGRPAAPVFTSLIRAVAFMQAAVLAGALLGVNKVGKFPAAAACRWPFLLVVDPLFEHWQAGLPAGGGWRWEPADPAVAVHDES